ncbi:MAG: cysteine desulfurase family protein [bacterium]|nr:cysteine desulfurase family protein [bacterium]
MASSRKVRRVYLDHASATPVDPRVMRAMAPYFTKEFGNPSALYDEGVRAKKAVEKARKDIAVLLSARPEEIIFTNGATESLNLALRGAVAAWKKTHPGKTPELVVSSIEHEAVLGAARALGETGVKISYVKPDERGIVRAKDVAARLSKNTVLVSVMYANNEIGTIQPVKEIGRLIKLWKLAHSKDYRLKTIDYPLFHTDAVQAANYLPLHVGSLNADLLTLGAGKIYGPKGIGLLYAKRGVPLGPLLTGGGQEKGMRPGTEQVPSIVGLAAALLLAQKLKDKESKRLTALRDGFIKKLLSLPGVELNGDSKARLPNNVNIAVKGIENELFMLRLDARGIACSTKSACKEGSDEASHVILSLGKSRMTANESLRLTLGRGTTKKDLDDTFAAIKELLAKNY